jgi:heme/copper-type cytochrome/quinol oxidase subunit 2
MSPYLYNFIAIAGFPIPANETMFSIISLLTEMTILLSYILISVMLVLIYINAYYNADVNPSPRHFEKSVESTLDVLFVIFPTIIIIYLLIPSLGFIFNNELAIDTIFEIDVIGHQWYWSYEYNVSIGTALYNLLGEDELFSNKIEFDSLMDTDSSHNRLLQVDKRVIIPSHSYIKVNITSLDVIHSWAVPQLGIKYDAIPGRVLSFILNCNAVGIYYGQCSELCGVNHAFMPISIQCVEPIQFTDWLCIASGWNPSSTILECTYLQRII